MKLFLTRNVAKIECPWLDRDMLKGESVWSYETHTYGCVSSDGIAVTLVAGEDPFFELPRNALSSTPPYHLPAGIISQHTNHSDMHADFIAWMERQPLLWEAMQGRSKGWKATDYFIHSSSDESDYAASIFDIMNDLTPYLPEGHMFGFSEGKIGIFYCPITIVVEEEKPLPAYDEQTIKTLQMIAAIMEQIAPMAETMARLSGATIVRLGDQISDGDKFFLHSARELARMETKNGSSLDFIHRRLMGEINHRVNMNNRKR